MKTALILHGFSPQKKLFSFKPTSRRWWLPWLQQQFLDAGWQCRIPLFPLPDCPVYEEWKQTLEQFTPRELSFLIAHGAGAGFIVKYLQKNRLRLEKLLLVAPWLDPEQKFGNFLQTDLNAEALNGIKEIHLMFSEDDSADVRQTKDRLLTAYPQIIFHDYLNFGHFTSGKTGHSFQELWNLCR